MVCWDKAIVLPHLAAARLARVEAELWLEWLVSCPSQGHLRKPAPPPLAPGTRRARPPKGGPHSRFDFLPTTYIYPPFFSSSSTTLVTLFRQLHSFICIFCTPRPRRSLYCTPSFGPAQRSVLHSLERLIKHQQSDYYSPYTHSLQGILPTLELNSYTPYQNRTRSSKDLQQTQWPFSPS